MDTKRLDRGISEAFNRIITNDPEMIRFFMRNSPSYRYFSHRGNKDRYFWTTQKINYRGKSRYVAGIYRYIKSREVLKLVKRVGFAKRHKAKAWALKTKEKETAIKQPLIN